MLRRLHSDDKASVVAGFGRLAAGEIDQMTISYRSRPAPPREGYIWLEANCRLLRDWKDQPYEIVAALRDVTERKQLEFALIEARERAEQAVAVKSEFLAHLSHEIRTPMNGVLGLADLLLERPLDDVGRSYVRLISESGETMMKLLNDILDIAKVDAGRLQLASETFDLHDCLAKSLSLMTASAVRKGLALELVMADDVPRRIVGDSLRLRQILANLIGNAVKFTESGHVRLEAAVEPGAESEAAGGGADTLVIAVEDSGIGIAEGLQARVFDEFTQADAGTADSFGGTGLGLAISRRLAEAFGGTLTLTSIPGKGTRLIMRMPLLLPGAEIALPALAPAAVDRPTMAPLHLLVAEDNRTNQLIIGAMLERLGHSCVMVARGDAVLDEVRAAKASGRCFDAVLMDLLMPGMDGREATHALRQAGHGPADLPIIAVTANGFAQDIEACRAAGMQGHLVKPVRIDALAAELARIVDATRTVHAA
jgi:signal transduction histidine kinase/AmiR/NasT family two-component response regulator